MKKLLQLQSIILLGGTLFAWYTVYQDFVRFYAVEGGLFKVQDCLIPNPVTTPCFYGAFAFLIAFVWSLKIIKFADEKKKLNQRRLVWLLIASTLFAWGNFTYTLYKFWLSRGEPTIGCSGILSGSPWVTPCFIGALIFLAALVAGLVIKKKMKSGFILNQVERIDS
ncbi:MAG: hypothetical protein ABIJ91_05470 [Candidatus Kuenenbacteria bacterium]